MNKHKTKTKNKGERGKRRGGWSDGWRGKGQRIRYRQRKHMKVPCNALLLAAILTATSRTIQKGKQQEQFLNSDDSVTSPRMYAYCMLTT